jgi:predicted membrane channel-forming protein YqfA (hemolysin III family)
MDFNNSCIQGNDTQNMIFNVGVHVTILFIILSVFFILVISKVSHDAINNEFVDIIDENLGHQIKNILNENPATVPIASMISTDRLFKDEDRTVTMNNKWLYRIIYLSFAFLIILCILYPVILKYQCNTCLPIKNILLMNGVIFLFIGVVEYIFFKNIAMKYIPVKPSLLVVSLLDDVKKILQ